MSDVLTIELPDELVREVERLARERGVTPEEFVVRATADRVGAAVSAAAYFAERATRARPGTARQFFSREGGEKPRRGDESD